MTPTDRRRRARRLLADVLHGRWGYAWAIVCDLIEAHVRAFRARPVRKGKRR